MKGLIMIQPFAPVTNELRFTRAGMVAMGQITWEMRPADAVVKNVRVAIISADFKMITATALLAATQRMSNVTADTMYLYKYMIPFQYLSRWNYAYYLEQIKTLKTPIPVEFTDTGIPIIDIPDDILDGAEYI